MADVLERNKAQREAKRYDGIWWGGAFIWIGLALAGDHLEILPQIDGEWWPWIFIGIGPWSLVLNTYQTASSTAPNPSTWDWIWTVAFIAIATGSVLDLTGALVGALALIVIGVVVLIGAITGRD